jgi:hypothetical protein
MIARATTTFGDQTKMAPQSHPQAQFVPISPDFDLNALVENTNNFDYVTIIHGKAQGALDPEL